MGEELALMMTVRRCIRHELKGSGVIEVAKRRDAHAVDDVRL